MTCATCQKDIAAGSKFCYSCGAKQPETPAAAPSPAYYTPRKRFVRSTNDRKVAGVCAGVADYFDMDPTLVRILWALATLIPVPTFSLTSLFGLRQTRAQRGWPALGHRCFLGFH